MFPSGQSDDDFLLHYNPHQGDSSQQDLILGQSLVERNSKNMGKGQRHKILATAKDDDGNIENNYEKKNIRKEIERQRRLNMTMLHASLRSLLPLESIKGKRSVSDHISEAVNYIKYLKKNIEDLNVKRDQLKKLLNSEALDQANPRSDNCLTNCVTVHPYLGGVEIVISSVHKEKHLLLSKILEAVLEEEEGLDVVRCVSTQTEERFFHTVQTEVGDLTCVDLPGLQQKLNHLIMTPDIYVSD
ncbi:transcription factor bHLH [Melia azedarach]|uniref:Transcription factor bHLH n=1 Tax=Melia azedarach TaxID=155640 RepID=A0ACC1X4L2_MELAZ|nr:transcription factor bHLH [Melia azedarach]